MTNLAADEDRAPGRHRASLVLRVLTGLQKGAQARMRHQRLLVGNLESECDVVLDIGRPDRHACLVRASRDGWTVLAIAGDLWVGEVPVALQQTREIVSGDVLTLGQVSFCVADTATIDWSKVQVPVTKAASKAVVEPALSPGRQKASRSSGWVEQLPAAWFSQFRKTRGFVRRFGQPGAAIPGAVSKHRRGDGKVLIGVLSMVALALMAVGVYLIAAPFQGHPSSTPRPQVMDAARAVLAGLPWANELTVQPDPHRTGRVLLGGYLPERERSAALEAALRPQAIEAEHRWTAVDELGVDLTRRLGIQDEVGASPLHYGGQGRFQVSSTRSSFDKLDPLIRRVLQDLPPVQGVELRLIDELSEGKELDPTSAPAREAGTRAAPPIVVRYARTEAAPGGVTVTGLEQLQPMQKLQRLEVRELRLGKLSSVVLDNEARYFEGSTLPGGALLVDIQPDHLLVRAGNDTNRIDLDDRLQLMAWDADRRSVAPSPRKAPAGR